MTALQNELRHNLKNVATLQHWIDNRINLWARGVKGMMTWPHRVGHDFYTALGVLDFSYVCDIKRTLSC